MAPPGAVLTSVSSSQSRGRCLPHGSNHERRPVPLPLAPSLSLRPVSLSPDAVESPLPLPARRPHADPVCPVSAELPDRPPRFSLQSTPGFGRAQVGRVPARPGALPWRPETGPSCGLRSTWARDGHPGTPAVGAALDCHGAGHAGPCCPDPSKPSRVHQPRCPLHLECCPQPHSAAHLLLGVLVHVPRARRRLC